MNTEQKAKAYDKAVEAAFIAYKDEDRHLKATLERIFPELFESEDEKIRKAILGLVRQSSEILGKQNQNNMISWLEKRGEQNPTAWSEEDERERKRIIELLEGWLSTFKETCYAEDCKCGIVWLKSLKERIGE